jgi:hypothetical protein
MRCSQLLAGMLGLGALTGLAAADYTAFTLEGMGNGGYSGRTGGPTPGVIPGDVASMSLIMMDGGANPESVNALGDGLILRGSGQYSDLGANRNGGGHVQAIWDEVLQGNATSIIAIFKTSDGSQFLPASSEVNGQPAQFWTWRFGMTDPVNFQPSVTGVTLNSAHVYFSNDGGQSFTGSTDITSNLSTNWNPGRDPGLSMASIGDGTNFLMLEYQITVVPAPAGMAALAGGSLLALRRRRR